MKHCSRRDFLQKSAIGLSGLAMAGSRVFSETTPIKQVYVPKMAVNPDISNLRVVCGANTAMIKGEPTSWDMAGQNVPVDGGQVQRTMDAIAVSLSNKATVGDAWKTIFRKPENKNWDAVKAAIKVNCIGKNHPRIALVNKICLELGALGVLNRNIYIYDGTHNAAPLYSPYIDKGLPASIIVSDKSKALGGTMKLMIPEKNKFAEYNCTTMIADGSIDILVNIAVNKSHDKNLGGTTLTLKNHAGTFEPKRIHLGGGLDYILGFSKSNALWGGSPVRQQLCIVDSLWCSAKGGPFVAPDKRLDRIVMGTFSGAVDYCVAKKIREPLMGAQHGPIVRFVNEFGYEETEMTEWVSITV